MKLTKYGHACIVLEEGSKRLVIDPGVFTDDFGGTANIVAVVITHIHQDHCSEDAISAIISANPDVVIFTTKDVADRFRQPNIIAVKNGQTETVGPFSLAFSGDMHAKLPANAPALYNTAVMVNEQFFYPGDSYTEPNVPITTLAVPANAPWMRAEESMDYITRVRPKRCIPTHNGLLSEAGHSIYNGALQGAAEQAGALFTYLKPGESIDL